MEKGRKQNSGRNGKQERETKETRAISRARVRALEGKRERARVSSFFYLASLSRARPATSLFPRAPRLLLSTASLSTPLPLPPPLRRARRKGAANTRAPRRWSPGCRCTGGATRRSAGSRPRRRGGGSRARASEPLTRRRSERMQRERRRESSPPLFLEPRKGRNPWSERGAYTRKK